MHYNQVIPMCVLNYKINNEKVRVHGFDYSFEYECPVKNDKSRKWNKLKNIIKPYCIV